mgnify:FL=1|tara:strand:- start:1508 stop:1702 length:195 start_codon:yes stop_codon:yes gene_type:complete
MKPKPINTLDTTLQSKKMSIDTPIGKIESDSGNHYIDILSIIFVIAVLYVGKKYLDQIIEKFRL